jgi:hypothetical protein
MMTCGGVDVQIHLVFILSLPASEWPVPCPCHLTLREMASDISSAGDRAGLRFDLDDMEKREFLALLGLELGTLSSPPRRQSLY